MVVFDDELTPSQQSNVERVIKGVKVFDRTAIILDIFALHAATSEGRLQVKLAQDEYLLPRLRGMWSHFASGRMGGGVGSRFGEGESQLEVDRRMVRRRIERTRKALVKLKRERAVQRKRREASDVMRVAIAGYSNAGKSSLLNALTGSDVLAYDKLFATLDSTTRRLELPGGKVVALTDTVGFIQKLPTSLIEAFNSTLEEIVLCDLIILLFDGAAEMVQSQIETVKKTLAAIDASSVPMLTAFNKIDMLDEEGLRALKAQHPGALFVSAVTGEGLDGLKACLNRFSASPSEELHVVIPFGQGSLVRIAHEKCNVLLERYSEDGAEMHIRAPKNLAERFRPYAKH
jgi:GTP-binding protein HflX